MSLQINVWLFAIIIPTILKQVLYTFLKSDQTVYIYACMDIYFRISPTINVIISILLFWGEKTSPTQIIK